MRPLLETANSYSSAMLVLPNSLTLLEAREALRGLSQALKREGDAVVKVDASNLRRFDSAALAVLLQCRRLAEAADKDFMLHHAPPRLVELACLYGLDELLVTKDGATELSKVLSHI